MGKSLVLGIKLLLITAVAALCLSLTNNLTAPVIKAKKQQELKDSFQVVFKDADNFEELEKDKKDQLSDMIVSCYKATKGGDLLGYVFEVDAPGGYSGNIDYIVGVNKDDVTTGFKALSHSESAGFGKKIEEDFFVDGVTGVNLTEEVKASESGSNDNEIVAISGATYSTNAVLGGLNAVRDAMKTLK